MTQDTRGKLIAHVDAASISLRQAAAVAALEGEWRTVELLSRMCKDLAGFQTAEGSNGQPEAAPRLESSPSRVAKKVSGLRSQPKKKKPSFSCSKAYLFKTSWSSKKKSTYTQRAPVELVVHLITAILSARGSTFKMEDLLPMRNPENREYPNYQAYLVLAWMRAEGLIATEERGVYRTPTKNTDSLAQARLDELMAQSQEKND